MRIAVVAQNVVHRDGQGRVTAELTAALAARGHDVTVYSHRIDPDLAANAHVAFTEIPQAPGPQLLDDVAFLLRATRALHRSRYDLTIMVGATARADSPSIYFTQFSHRGWRATWTTGSRPPLPHRVHAAVASRLETWAARRADAVLSTTTALAHETLGRHTAAASVLVAPLGIDTVEFEPSSDEHAAACRSHFGIPEGRTVVGFLGGYATGRKGLTPLLHALAAGPGPQSLHLIVAGGGPAGHVEQLIDQLSLRANVTLAGFVDPHDVIAAADVVAVPSTYEPFSLVALEAAAAGRPVVISACAGAAPLLGAGAVVIEDAGNPLALRGAIDALALDPHERAMRGGAARAAVAGHTWARAMEHAVDLVEGFFGVERAHA